MGQRWVETRKGKEESPLGDGEREDLARHTPFELEGGQGCVLARAQARFTHPPPNPIRSGSVALHPRGEARRPWAEDG